MWSTYCIARTRTRTWILHRVSTCSLGLIFRAWSPWRRHRQHVIRLTLRAVLSIEQESNKLWTSVEHALSASDESLIMTTRRACRSTDRHRHLLGSRPGRHATALPPMYYDADYDCVCDTQWYHNALDHQAEFTVRKTPWHVVCTCVHECWNVAIKDYMPKAVRHIGTPGCCDRNGFYTQPNV